MTIRPDDDLVTIDRTYLRRQAREALSTFVAPLSGLVHAVAPPRRSDAREGQAGVEL